MREGDTMVRPKAATGFEPVAAWSARYPRGCQVAGERGVQPDVSASGPEAADLLVIGGGISGACIARDAAGRGLDVLLCEKDDLAAHISSASARLVHGGLRYEKKRRMPADGVRRLCAYLETGTGTRYTARTGGYSPGSDPGAP